MSIKISIEHDIKRLRRTLKKQQRELIPKMVSQALNRTAQQVRTRMGGKVAKAMGLKAGIVKGEMRIVKASWRKLYAVVIAEGRRFNLARFDARQVKAGVSANAWGKRRVYPRAFLALGDKTVFIRLTSKRLPLRVVRGPSTPRTLATAALEAESKEVIDERWPINLDQAARRYLKSDKRPR